jgi:phosphoribosyl-ATP pyrophosphohydrolase
MADAPTDRWQAVDAVRRWLESAGFPVHDRPTLDISDWGREMACALIEEEAAELRAAVGASDLVEIADALADLVWVTLEAAVTFGIPIEEVFAEVERSNWTKIDTADVRRNAAGKIVAGPGFSPPDLAPILEAHGWLRGTPRA